MPGTVTGMVISPGASGTTEHELYQVGATVRRQPIVRPIMSTSETDGQPAIAATSAQLFAANTDRHVVFLSPRSPAGDIYIRFDSTAVTATNWHMRVLSTSTLVVIEGGPAPLEWTWMGAVAGGNLNWWAGLNGA